MKNISNIIFFIVLLQIKEVYSQSELTRKKPLVKTNWLLNPGAEANSEEKPFHWMTDYPNAGNSNWVSEYGKTIHEWAFECNEGCGLPKNAGFNYFRLDVGADELNRKVNIYQTHSMEPLNSNQIGDTIVAFFSGWVASNSYQSNQCSHLTLSLVFFDSGGSIIDSIQIKKVPTQFRDLDANSSESIERGFSLMHEFIPFQLSMNLPPKSHLVKVECFSEITCAPKDKEDEVNQDSFSNTFYLDNLQLQFFKK